MLFSFHFLFLSVFKRIRMFINFYASFYFIFSTNLYLLVRRVSTKTFFFFSTSTIPIFRDKRQLPEQPRTLLFLQCFYPDCSWCQCASQTTIPGEWNILVAIKGIFSLAYLMVVYTSPSHHSFGFLSISARRFLQVSHWILSLRASDMSSVYKPCLLSFPLSSLDKPYLFTSIFQSHELA